MTIEILITAGIVASAVFVLYNSFRKKSSGGCSCCGNCKESKRKLRGQS